METKNQNVEGVLQKAKQAVELKKQENDAGKFFKRFLFEEDERGKFKVEELAEIIFQKSKGIFDDALTPEKREDLAFKNAQFLINLVSDKDKGAAVNINNTNSMVSNVSDELEERYAKIIEGDTVTVE